MPAILHASGSWISSRVTSRAVACTQAIPPELVARMEALWADALAARAARGGGLLFDGPMARLERFAATADRFEFDFSHTSYKSFFALHQSHPEWLDALPASVARAARADPLGVSAALCSADGLLLVGRRSPKVAYHPGRVHPFAGSLDPADAGDLFGALRRELAEELNLRPGEITGERLLGLIEDPALRHPEAVLACRTTLTAAEVRARLDATEHDAMIPLRSDVETLRRTLADPELTPVCAAALLLWARAHLDPTFDVPGVLSVSTPG